MSYRVSMCRASTDACWDVIFLWTFQGDRGVYGTAVVGITLTRAPDR